MTRIVVADDHPVVLGGLRMMFENSAGYELIGEASSLKETLTVCETLRPDVLILDLNFDGKSSLDLVPELRSRFTALKILVFSAYYSTGLVKKALEAGVQGYLLKDASKTEWTEALSRLVQGKTYLSKHISGVAFKLDEFQNSDFNQLTNLSEREKNIIQLIANGLMEDKIAETLFISKHTVHTHKKNIFKKLQLHTNARAFS
ncbi:response regulator transcription factor [Runella sp.]|jgi:DNA-binding NarL/FixJ family response regulator|uniref:response regulator n=1 Tax=Runella sp. TaxID=1960881 RepID=UPI002604B011|nr:response regulator transcription factor [Runella sp.]